MDKEPSGRRCSVNTLSWVTKPCSILVLHDDNLLTENRWPGSFYELSKVLGPLSNPEDSSLPAFHCVAPSIPGYGFSEGPKKPGFKLGCVAEAYDKLMKRLGYKHYGGSSPTNFRFLVAALGVGERRIDEEGKYCLLGISRAEIWVGRLGNQEN